MKSDMRALFDSGTNAEYHLVDERIVSLKPGILDFNQAAALSLAVIAAWSIGPNF